jgi:hypothetical protein
VNEPSRNHANTLKVTGADISSHIKPAAARGMRSSLPTARKAGTTITEEL